MKLNKQIIFLGLISLFTDIASEMLYPVMPIFLSSVLGASMISIGLLEGVAEFTAGILKGYSGALSDKLKKRSIFVAVGYSVSAIVKPLPGLLASFPVILSTRIIDRIGKGIRTAPRDAMLADYSDGNTGRVFGFHRSMDTTGAAIGPIISLILLFIYPGNYKLIFLAAFIPSVIAIFFTYLLKDKVFEAKEKLRKSFSGFWKNSPKKYKQMVILLGIFSFANSSDVFLILKVSSISKYSSMGIGAYVLYNIVYAILAYPSGIIADRYSKKKVLTTGLFIFSIVYAGMAFTQSLTFAALFLVLYGIYAATTEGIAKAWVSDLITQEERGTAIGLLTLVMSVSVLTGSVAAGAIWDFYGSSYTFGLSSLISLIVAIFFIFV